MKKMELSSRMKKKMSILRVSVHGRGLLHKIQAGLLLERQSYGSTHCSVHVLATMSFFNYYRTLKDGRQIFAVVQWDDEPELKTQIKRSR